MPPTVEHYIHRVGRTARAGRSGVSVSIASEQDRKVLKEVIRKAKNPVKNRVIPIGGYCLLIFNNIFIMVLLYTIIIL